MKIKQILILACLLLVLIVGVVIKSIQKTPQLSTEEFASLDLSFDASKVAQMKIMKGKDQKLVELVKTGDVWGVVSFHQARADQEKISNFLNALQQVKGELRGQDKELFADFGIEDESAYQVIVSDSADAELIHFSLGTKKAYGGVFLKQWGLDTVYYVSTDLFHQMGFYEDPKEKTPKSDYWASLSLADYQVDAISRIESVRLDGAVPIHVFRQTDPNDLSKKAWRYQRTNLPFQLDAEKVKQFLNSLKNYKANKVLDLEAKDYGLERPELILKLGSEDGKEITFKAGAPDPNTQVRYLQVSTEPVVFELADYYFKNLNGDDSRFFVDNPLGIDPEKTSKLTVQTTAQKVDVDVKTKSSDTVTGYLNNLKTFTATRLLFQEKDIKKLAGGKAQILSLQKESGETIMLKVGEIVAEQPQEYAARFSSETLPFAISEATFKSIFENLDRLSESKG